MVAFDSVDIEIPKDYQKERFIIIEVFFLFFFLFPFFLFCFIIALYLIDCPSICIFIKMLCQTNCSLQTSKRAIIDVSFWRISNGSTDTT